MGEEVRMSEYNVSSYEDRVPEWEMGLPSDEDLASLSYILIPPNLAMAFSITPEKSRTIQDVNRASETTLSSLRSGSSGPNTSSSNNNSNTFKTGVEEDDRVGSSSPGSDSKKQKTSDDASGVDLSTADAAAAAEEGDSGTEDPTGKTLKRARLVWTPQLHKRFVDVVAHLGIKNAVPKTIMQLMNVEGLTRENVASHLQKYRLYLKRMQGLTTDGGPSSSDKLFSSTPVTPQSFKEIGGGNGNGNGQGNGLAGHVGVPIQMPYGAPPIMQMPVYAHHMGMQGYHHQNHGHDPYHQNHHHHHGTGGPGAFEANPYTMQQNKYGSMASYPSVGGGSANEN